MPRKANCTLKFEPITVDSISRIIGDLKPKTSTGVDIISNKLLKFVKNVISEPLSIIINQMLKLGIFPDSLKKSKVVREEMRVVFFRTYKTYLYAQNEISYEYIQILF